MVAETGKQREATHKRAAEIHSISYSTLSGGAERIAFVDWLMEWPWQSKEGWLIGIKAYGLARHPWGWKKPLHPSLARLLYKLHELDRRRPIPILGHTEYYG